MYLVPNTHRTRSRNPPQLPLYHDIWEEWTTHPVITDAAEHAELDQFCLQPDPTRLRPGSISVRLGSSLRQVGSPNAYIVMRVYGFQELMEARTRAFIRGQRARGERFGIEDSFAFASATVA